MTTTSALTSQLGANMAATDLVPTIDVSDTAMAASGTAKKSTLLEFMRGGIGAVFTQRGLIAAFSLYNPGDVVTMSDGRVVLIKTACQAGAGPTPFIGSANYVLIGWQYVINAQSYGLLADASQASASINSAALQAALNAANPTVANGAGGIVVLPRGNFYTNAFIQIPIGVTLQGNAAFGTYWSLADDSNCSMVGPHVSTGAGNANAFYWGLRDLSMDCRQASQGSHAITDVSMTVSSTTITSASRNWVNGEHVVGSGILPGTTIASGGGTLTGVLSQAAQQTLSPATVYAGLAGEIYGVHCNINPLTSQQSGDWGFDPSGFINNVIIKNARDAAFANFGRSANVYLRCKTSSSLGIGFIGSFDSRYLSCESDFSAWHGFDFRGSSEQISNCKSYNSGQTKTTAAAATNIAHGYVFNGFTGFGGIAVSGCDAQQNTGNGFHLITCTGVSIAGCTAAGIGFTSAVTTAVGFSLSNCNGCTIIASVGVQPSNHCYTLTSGSTENTLILGFTGTSKGTAAGAGNTDTGNCVVVNGTAINFPGLVSSATVAMAIDRPYARASSSGGNIYSPGTILATTAAAVLNRAEYLRLTLADRAGQTITGLNMRVGTGVATAVFRCGIYSSDFTGTDTWNLEAELATTVDASVTGVKGTSFTVPINVDPAKLYWICTAPQVALGATFTSVGGALVASGSNLGANTAFILAGVSGALPATRAWGTAAPPGATGAAVQQCAVVLG